MQNIQADLPRILLVGDSITARGCQPDDLGGGWVSRLQDAYIRKLDVVNRGNGGYNTKMTLEILPWIVRGSATHELIVIFLGANDAAVNEKQQLTLEEFEENLNAMIELLASDDETKRLLLITPPPVHEQAWTQHCLEKGNAPDRSYKRTREFRDVVMKVADAWSTQLEEVGMEVACLDTWTLFLSKQPLTMIRNETMGVVACTGLPDGVEQVDYDAQHIQQYLSDGLHLSGLGNLVLYQGVINLIKKQWPEMDPETLKMGTAPYWWLSTEQCQNPEMSFLIRGWHEKI
jgi:lysophospholipase L1-like esterase